MRYDLKDNFIWRLVSTSCSRKYSASPGIRELQTSCLAAVNVWQYFDIAFSPRVKEQMPFQKKTVPVKISFMLQLSVSQPQKVSEVKSALVTHTHTPDSRHANLHQPLLQPL